MAGAGSCLAVAGCRSRGVSKMENVLQRIQKNETRLDEHDRRLFNLENMQAQLSEMNATTRLLAQSMKSVETKVVEIDKRFMAHELEPASNWKKLGWSVLILLLGAIVGIVFAKIGLQP